MDNSTMRRGLVLATLTTPLLTGCPWSRSFDLAWNEEIRLPDGRTLLVTTRVQFQQAGTFSKYDNALRRTTTLKFESDDKGGVVTFRTWLLPVFLNRIDGNWYLVLSGQGPFGKTDESAEQWGHDFSTREQRLAILEGGLFRAITWDLAPPSIRRENLLPLMDAPELAKLDGKTISTGEKEKLLEDEYQGLGKRLITRPQRVNRAT